MNVTCLQERSTKLTGYDCGCSRIEAVNYKYSTNPCHEQTWKLSDGCAIIWATNTSILSSVKSLELLTFFPGMCKTWGSCMYVRKHVNFVHLLREQVTCILFPRQIFHCTISQCQNNDLKTLTCNCLILRVHERIIIPVVFLIKCECLSMMIAKQ